MSAYFRYAACAAALLLAACGKSPAALKCLPCSSDAECQSPAFCSRGYCVANGEDPRRCPQQVGASASSGTGATSSGASTSGTSTAGSTSSTSTSGGSTGSTSSTSSGSASASGSSSSTSGSSGSSTSSSSSSTTTSGTTTSGTTTSGTTTSGTTTSGTTTSGTSTTGTSTTGTSTTGTSTTGTSTTGGTASCTDGVKNGTETDVDCGGTCPPCALGLGCARNADCASSFCLGGACACNGELTPIPQPPGATGPILTAVTGRSDAPVIAVFDSAATVAATCSAGCNQGSPTFSSAAANTVSGQVWGGAIASVGDGGAALALGFRTGSDQVTVGECSGDCGQSASWSFGEYGDASQSRSIPGVLAIGSLRAVAYPGTVGGLSGTVYAECLASCGTTSNWRSVRAASSSAGSQRATALAISLVTGGPSTPVRHLAFSQEYDSCSGNTCFSGLWTRTLLPPTANSGQSVRFDTDVRMAIDAQGLPHLAGADCCRVYAATCMLWPCSDSANWITIRVAQDASGGNPDTVGFALDTSGLGHIVYDGQQGLTEADETSPGAWTTHPLTTCDGLPLGAAGGKTTSPSLMLTPSGSPRVAFIQPSALPLPDGGSIPAGPVWYVSGP